MFLKSLRQKHPRFYYHNYHYSWQTQRFKITFDLEIEPQIFFSPEVVIEGLPKERVTQISPEVLENLVFHLGLAEIPSYWKAACSPEIVINAGKLDKYQIAWWKDLLLKGLGEFFYVNQINFTTADFVKIKNKTNPTLPTSTPLASASFSPSEVRRSKAHRRKVLVPLGGGKDSLVTLELLKKYSDDLSGFALNPTPATLASFQISQISKLIVVKRSIDRNLIKLNRSGYLNGHTPFSAYLAFLSTLCAILFGYDQVAVSNERSSYEGNVFYLGKEVNHQYSKSLEFEERFSEYSKKYLSSTVAYFSFLRPLYELQIAKLFANYPGYFSVFRSCNRGQKTNSWCQQCPKCLFVFTALYPFIEEKTLIQRIFSTNLFWNRSLFSLALSLLGQGRQKPFECVGTFEETKIAFYLCVKTFQKRKPQSKLPILLRLVNEQVLKKEVRLGEKAKNLLSSFGKEHCLSKELETFLKHAIQ